MVLLRGECWGAALDRVFLNRAFASLLPERSAKKFAPDPLSAIRARAEADQGLDLLREALGAIRSEALIDGLLGMARRDSELADALKRMCLDALSRG